MWTKYWLFWYSLAVQVQEQHFWLRSLFGLWIGLNVWTIIVCQLVNPKCNVLLITLYCSSMSHGSFRLNVLQYSVFWSTAIWKCCRYATKRLAVKECWIIWHTSSPLSLGGALILAWFWFTALHWGGGVFILCNNKNSENSARKQSY